MNIIILLCLLTAVLGYRYNDTLIEEDFRVVDKNADGNLALDEMYAAFKRIDKNGDSRITFVEFDKGLRPGVSLALSNAAFNIYDQLDGHKDNVINLSDSKLIFSLLDHDNNKNLTLEEYTHAVKLIIERSFHDAGITA